MKLLEATNFEDINHRPRPRKWRQDSATIVASFRSQATNMGGGYSFPVTICSLASHQKPVEFSPIWSLQFIQSKLNTRKEKVTDCYFKMVRNCWKQLFRGYFKAKVTITCQTLLWKFGNVVAVCPSFSNIFLLKDPSLIWIRQDT